MAGTVKEYLTVDNPQRVVVHPPRWTVEREAITPGLSVHRVQAAGGEMKVEFYGVVETLRALM